jgi:hypothetical protein
MPAILFAVVEIVSKLNEQILQFACFYERPETIMKVFDYFGVDFAFVRKALVQLGGEEKIRFVRGFFKPRPGRLLKGRPVEGAVDFDAIHKLAYILKLVGL